MLANARNQNFTADDTDQPSPGSHGIADIAVIGKPEIPSSRL
jgi:hypothetical protein